MALQSERKTIKSISKYRYEVVLSEDDNGIFYVTYTNLLNNKTDTVSFADYNMATCVFDSKINSYEGN